MYNSKDQVILGKTSFLEFLVSSTQSNALLKISPDSVLYAQVMNKGVLDVMELPDLNLPLSPPNPHISNFYPFLQQSLSSSPNSKRR